MEYRRRSVFIQLCGLLLTGCVTALFESSGQALQSAEY